MPVIRIDDEVWQWLQSRAQPLVDNPNSVLRRVAGLDDSITSETQPEDAAVREARTGGAASSRVPANRVSHIPGNLGSTGGQPRRPRRKGMSLVGALKTELRQQGQGASVGTWEHGGRRSRNIVQIGSGGTAILVYVKVRTEAPGFWGLNQNQLASLVSSGMPWYVVLIEGSSQTHYLLSGRRVEDAIRERRWTESHGDYKIHENHELRGTPSYDSAAAIAAELLSAT